MISKRILCHILLLAFTVSTTACGINPTNTPQPVVSATPPPPTPTEQPSSDATPTSRKLTIWLAPTFAPNPETTAGAIISNRLAEFEAQHPGLSIDVRIKSRSGAGSLLETLTAADVAAPSSLPDLVTLDSFSLSEAAKLGLLMPLDDLIDIPTEPDWYPYVLASLRFDSQTIGMPFASETDILAFRTDLYPSAPRRIETLLAEGHTFQFPAGDPLAQFTLAQYLALSGTLTNSEGKAFIDVESLTEVLSFYQTAIEANVIPLTVRQWTDTTQVWSEIKANRTASAVVPLSLFLQEHDPERLNGAPLPTSTDTGIALAHTWAWGLVTKGSQSDQLKIELLNHLMDPSFLGPWTEALGVLPPNGAALAAWNEGPDSALVSSLVTVARPLPPRSVRTTISAALLEAVEAVLTGTLEPSAAAQAAADAVAAP
jgi:ABC-type glycerol-3-phosphate transport system substrate-binding protein